MKAIQLKQPKQFEIVDIDAPQSPGPGEVVVKTHRMGICGTDYSCYLGKFPFFDYPRIPGHELGVEVVEVGEGVTNVKAGFRCSVEPYINCGECFACRRGHGNCCANLKVVGVMMDGGLCERFTIQADKLHHSESLSFEQLSLVETLAIGFHATERGAPKTEDHALIIGAGPIGLATLEFTRLATKNVTVMDRVQSRLDFCKANYGIENLVLFDNEESAIQQMKQITGGDMYSVVTDATGNKHSMASAIGYVAPTGTLVYVGITTEEIVFPHPKMHRPEATIKASRNAMPGDFGKIISLIEEGTVDTSPWITHRTTFDNVADEFEQFTKPETGVIKAIIEVT